MLRWRISDSVSLTYREGHDRRQLKDQQSVAEGPSRAVCPPGLTEFPVRSRCDKLLRRLRWRFPIQPRRLLLLTVTSGRCCQQVVYVLDQLFCPEKERDQGRQLLVRRARGSSRVILGPPARKKIDRMGLRSHWRRHQRRTAQAVLKLGRCGEQKPCRRLFQLDGAGLMRRGELPDPQPILQPGTSAWQSELSYPLSPR